MTNNAIEKLNAADATLRQALAEIGNQEIDPAFHHHMAAARKSVDRARAILERRERLKRHEALARVRAGGIR